MCQNQIGLRDIQNSAIEQDKNLKRKNLELGRNAISCAVVTLIVTAVLMIAPHEAVASATITQKNRTALYKMSHNATGPKRLWKQI
jgi:hypothetical protein